jgi:hypothetical protein
MNTKDIVFLAEAYGGHLGLKLSTISTYAAADGKWLDGLKSGASCTLRKAAVVTQWFSDRWPSDLEWPHDVPRPPKSKKEAA